MFHIVRRDPRGYRIMTAYNTRAEADVAFPAIAERALADAIGTPLATLSGRGSAIMLDDHDRIVLRCSMPDHSADNFDLSPLPSDEPAL